MKLTHKQCNVVILCVQLVLMIYFWLTNRDMSSRNERLQRRLVILRQMRNYAEEVCVDTKTEHLESTASKNKSRISSVNINDDLTVILMAANPECAKMQEDHLRYIHKNVKVQVAVSGTAERPNVLNTAINLVQTEYFIIIDETIALSNNNTKGVFEKLLVHMMDFDVLGSAVVMDGVYHIPCHGLHLRQWKLSERYEYHRKDNILQCMSTSTFFVGRTKIFKHNPFDGNLPLMWLEDFFIRLNGTISVGVLPEITIYKDRGTIMCHHGNLSVLSEVDRLIPFANKYQIFSIANSERVVDLCYNSGALVCNSDHLLSNWKMSSILTSGLTQYPFVIAALKKTVHFGDEWLREHDIPYSLEGGTSLGMIKRRDILPWDHGDIDTFAYCTRRGIVNMVVGVFRSEGIDYHLGGVAFHLYKNIKPDAIGDIVFMIRRVKPSSFIYVRHGYKLLSLSREIFKFLREFYGSLYFENHLKYTNGRTYCNVTGHHACMSDCRWHGCGGGMGVV